MQEIRRGDKTQVQEVLVSWYKFQDTQVLHQLHNGSHRKQKIFGANSNRYPTGSSSIKENQLLNSKVQDSESYTKSRRLHLKKKLSSGKDLRLERWQGYYRPARLPWKQRRKSVIDKETYISMKTVWDAATSSSSPNPPWRLTTGREDLEHVSTKVSIDTATMFKSDRNQFPKP
jgi:hypothetical protein